MDFDNSRYLLHFAYVAMILHLMKANCTTRDFISRAVTSAFPPLQRVFSRLGLL